MKKPLIFVIVGTVVVFLILAVLAFGFYRGYQVKSYASQVKNILEESITKWNQEKIDKASSKGVAELLALMRVMQKDSDSQLAKLNSLKAPARAKDLEKYAKDYFTVAKKGSTGSIKVLIYAQKVENSTKELESFGSQNINSFEALADMFANANKKIKKSLAELEDASPPAAYKSFHKSYVDTLEEFSVLLEKGEDYANQKNLAGIQNIIGNIEKVGNEMSSIKIPDQDKALEDIISKEEEQRLENYPEEIKKELNELSKVTFVF